MRVLPWRERGRLRRLAFKGRRIDDSADARLVREYLTAYLAVTSIRRISRPRRMAIVAQRAVTGTLVAILAVNGAWSGLAGIVGALAGLLLIRWRLSRTARANGWPA